MKQTLFPVQQIPNISHNGSASFSLLTLRFRGSLHSHPAGFDSSSLFRSNHQKPYIAYGHVRFRFFDLVKNKLAHNVTYLRFAALVFCCALTSTLFAQRPSAIFKDRKVINSFSTETLPTRSLDFRVGHRFGDLAGDNGGWETFYGLESAQDVLIGFDYGITDNLLIGLNRTKGAGPLRMLVSSYLKYKIAGQKNLDENPLAVSFVAMNSISTMPKSEETSAINNFPKFVHRMTHHFEMIVAKKFSERISLQFNVGLTHRNFVNLDDINSIVSVGGAGRFQVSRGFAILVDARLPMRFQEVEFDHTVPIGVGFEWETGGGHVFQLNFTNASGLSETDYLSNTRSRWSDGQFRFGFTIARQFKI